MVKSFILLVVCVALAVGRFFLPTHATSLAGSYEAVAHLLVGGLIGAWLVSKRWGYALLFLALSAVELVAFIRFR